MNINLKKRKKSVFNNYKTVRAAINLNQLTAQPVVYSQQETKDHNWEHNWIEQLTDMKAELSQANLPLSKQNKLILKWWEN